MIKKVLLIILILVSITAYLLKAQEILPPEKPLVSDSTIISREMSADRAGDEEKSIEMELAILKEKVETFSGRMNLIIGVLLVILAIGGIASLTSMFFAERRTREAHALAMTTERAAHERAQEVHQTFLEGSRTTLDLVNATLTLAKEASERAAKSIETKAITTLKELDRKSKELFAKGAKRLVAEPALRSEVHRLAQKIAGFEINLFILPPGFKLTPYCLFIRGIDFHLNQQFDDALECWKSVSLDDESPNELKSEACYWIGIENNNLGEFSEACRSFEEALKTTTGPDWYELKRILNESKFFNGECSQSLVSSLENLLSAIEKEAEREEYEEKRRGILTTLGNIYFQLGNELEKEDYEEAKKNWRSAKERFQKVPKESKWASFGLAEAHYKLGEKTQGERIFREIRSKFNDEYISKEEPRSKVLASTAELICCLRVPSLENEIRMVHSQVLESLGRVNELLTVYSLMQRRNVKKDEFRNDLTELMAERNQEAR